MFSNWKLFDDIISNKNSRFIFDFWIVMFKRFDIKLLMSTIYHSQIDGQSEKINQTIKIIFRFFLIVNSNADWMTALSLIQINMNNSSNAIIELIFSELMYDFKIKNRLTAVSKKINEQFMTNTKLKNFFDKTRF